MNNHWEKAFILFRNERKLKFLRILKKDFRHCAVILKSKTYWLYIDQTFFQLEIRVWEKTANPLEIFQKNNWNFFEILPPKISEKNLFRLGWIDCVSISKRILGIKKTFIFTPYQLYNHLKNNNFIK
ncbi:MAG: hypothetical protein ACTSXL_01195 [Alphaproteobacteria bacterium]